MVDEALVRYAAPALFAGLAALTDLRWRRIPNGLTLAGFVAGVVLQVVRFGPSGLLIALAGAALGLVLLLPFYVIRAIGAGDVKLLGALGALLGPLTLVSAALYGAVVGGVISAIMLAQRRKLARSFIDMVSNPMGMKRSGAKAPYGVAIASGVYLSMLLPSVVG